MNEKYDAFIKRDAEFDAWVELRELGDAQQLAHSAVHMLVELEKERDILKAAQKADKEAAQRAAMDLIFKNRAPTPATADFDLPEPNDAVAEPKQGVDMYGMTLLERDKFTAAFGIYDKYRHNFGDHGNDSFLSERDEILAEGWARACEFYGNNTK